ncbi:MAG: hypothetical protein WDN31_05525 [Hyphomicrobium sp.]
MRLLNLARAAAATLGLALGMMSAALPVAAQDMNTMVIVPDAPGGAAVAGCYSVSQRLYGPYRMDFCLQQRGTYTVRGGGVTCNGRLNWRARGGTIEVDLDRTSCGNGVAWSADTMDCKPNRIFGDGPASIIGDVFSKIIVPDRPTVNSLTCTYYPDARGEQPTTITARRN